MNPHFERGHLLFEHSRYDEAIKELQQALAEDPDEALVHAYLALSLCKVKRAAEALGAAQRAVHLGPESSFPHYVLAIVHDELDHRQEAEAAIAEAIRLDPQEPELFAFQSSLAFQRSAWAESLAAAERGLALDPENVQCNNLRAMALRQLGRRDEAAANLDAALARDPDYAVTHANKGWTLLHQGQHEQALACFRDALRLDPQLPLARAGIVEALKSRNIIYALMLRYFLLVSRLPPRVQTGLFIGLVIGVMAFAEVGRKQPQLRPWVEPVLVIYTIFVFSSWLAAPFFDLLLRLDPLGRYALSRRQLRTANWLGLTLAVAIGLDAFMLLRGTPFSFWTVLLPFLLVFPVITACHVRAGGTRLFMSGYSLVMAVALLGSILARWQALGVYIWGCAIASWLTNVLPHDTEWD